MAPLLRLHSVSVRLGPVAALQTLSLQLQEGERVAVLGPNGSGKSTLLRTVHGLLPLHSGRVERVREYRQAMLFQRPHLLRLSVLHNVALGLWLDRASRTGWRQACAQAYAALERVGLRELAGRSGRALSTGQQQRLALARAWATRPELLLLDEPTASLDPHARAEVEALMAQLAGGQGQPLTLMWATHQLGQARRMATRVLYLQAGRLLADLPVQDFFNPEVLARLSPQAHAFVQGETA